MLHPWMIPGDLAPGDSKSLQRDWSDIELHRIDSLSDPHFQMAFDALCTEFDAAGEMEQPFVLERRMRWDPARLQDGLALRYRMMLITSGGKFAAARDHTAIVQEGYPDAIVHLSHNLIHPDWRRSGLAGWMRALPIQTARTCLAAQGRPEDSPIVLVGEMEKSNSPAAVARLTAYEKSGYKMIEPTSIDYYQPDFATPEEIDAQGGPKPLPLNLLIRRVGRESHDSISGEEIRVLVRALYRMYQFGVRPCEMEPLFAHLETYPASSAQIPLVAPTSTIS